MANERVQPREGLARGVPRTTRDKPESSAETTGSDSRALTSVRGNATQKMPSRSVSLLTPDGGISKLAIRPRRVKYRRLAWRSIGFIFDEPPDPRLAAELRRRPASVSVLEVSIMVPDKILRKTSIPGLGTLAR